MKGKHQKGKWKSGGERRTRDVGREKSREEENKKKRSGKGRQIMEKRQMIEKSGRDGEGRNKEREKRRGKQENKRKESKKGLFLHTKVHPKQCNILYSTTKIAQGI